VQRDAISGRSRRWAEPKRGAAPVARHDDGFLAQVATLRERDRIEQRDFLNQVSLGDFLAISRTPLLDPDRASILFRRFRQIP